MAASTSTSSSADVYDVFINHRGPDVKKTLASHLYHRLISHELQVFLDYQELNVGENFDSEIKGAIKSASVHVAIFTETYAESNWCLDELQLMLESGSPIIPVFYKVKPTDLRWTRGKETGYARALLNLEKKRTYDSQSRYDSKTIENWRNALSTVSGISGFELDAFNGDEGKLVDKVVECVLQRVKKPQLDVAKYPTGLEEKAQDFERKVLSQQHSERVQVVGIAGLGGVGKTTLATELFNRKSSKYSKCYFLSDVREKARTSLNSLQANLLRGLNIFDRTADSVPEGIGKLRKYLSGSRILIVLDDVDHLDQVDALLPVDVLHPESLILITSRDKSVLTRSVIEESSIYELTGLDEHHSRELFCSHAFRQLHPASGFESLVDRFVKACQGLPLSLKVLGALVYGNKDKSDWEDRLEELKQILPTDIQKCLQISYDALDEEAKKIFLDIACIFIGEEKDIAITIWKGSGWRGKLGFQTLRDKCLVELDMGNRIRMHDHLRDLGRGLAKHPELPRRLWRGIDDIDDLKHHSYGITEVRGIKMVLMEHRDPNELEFFRQRIRNEDEDEAEQNDDEEDDEAEQNDDEKDDEDDDSSHPSRKFRKKWKTMLQLNEVKVTKLQLLDIDILSKHVLRGVQSPNLIWLRWSACHLSSLPSWIPMENLRVLEVYGNELTTLWQPKSKVPLQLRELRVFAPLSNIPKSIGKLKHLERIVVHRLGFQRQSVEEMLFFEELPKEFGHLRSLKALELTWFSKMRSLPDSFGNLTNLEHIDLSGCIGLERLPNTFRNLTMLKYLDLSHCQKLTLSGENLENIRTLEYISLRGCDNIEVLPSQVAHQRLLKKLYLVLINLKELPSDIGELSALEELEIESSLLETLPPSIGDLSNLKHLELSCHKLKCLPDSIRLLNQLTRLTVEKCPLRELPFKQAVEGESEKYCMHRLQHLELSSIQILDRISFGEGVCPNLQYLLIESCNDLAGVGTLPNALVKLKLRACCKLGKIEELCGLAELQTLDIQGCIEVEELPGFETLVSLEVLRAEGCVKLKSIRGSAEQTKLGSVEVSDCSDLEELPGFENLRSLEELSVSRCAMLKGIRGSAEQTKLRRVIVSDCSDLEELPGFENLRSLEELSVYECAKLKSIRGSAEQTKLRRVIVRGCSDLEELPGFENLRSLEEISVSGYAKLKSIRGSAELRIVRVNNSNLEELPGFENLRSLEELSVHECAKLKSIRGSAEQTKLRRVSVWGCSDLEELPGFENLRSLEELIVYECAKLKSIPGSAQWTELRKVSVDDCSGLEELPGFENLRSLEEFRVSGCAKLKSIRGSAQWTEELPGVENLRSLGELSASLCAKLKSIRGSAEQTKLRRVEVSNCSDLEELPGFENLRSLEELIVYKCAKLKSIPGSAQWTELREVRVYDCSGLEELPGFENLRSLVKLTVSRCAKLKSIPGSAQWTEELPGVENLRSLKILDVSGCVKLKSIPGLTQWTELETLIVSGCSDLEVLRGVENLRSLKYLDVSGCVKLKSVPGLAQLTELQILEVFGLSSLEELRGVENLRSLKYLDVSRCVKLKSVPGLAQLTELRVLKVNRCSDLQEVPGVEHLTSYVYIFAEKCPKLQWSEGLAEQLILKKRVTYIWPSHRNFQPMDISVSNIYIAIYRSSSRHWVVVESVIGEEVVEQLKQRGIRIPVNSSSHPVRWVVRGSVNSLDTLDCMSGYGMYVRKEESIIE